ncbi:hypothetical protein E5H85_21740 [Escherichia coli]|nr:hypothetical protein [Escherichia coli]
MYCVKSGYFATQLKPAVERVFVVSGLWYSLGLVYLALIHWLGFFYVSASDLRFVVLPQFAPLVSAR